MTEKQRRFAEAYAKNPNATAAAIAAGYSPKTAYSQGQRLLKDAEIKSYLESILKENQSEVICTVSQVRHFWSLVVNDEAEKMTARLKASELLARSMGMFVPEVAEIAGKGDPAAGGDVVIYFPAIEKLDDEEDESKEAVM